MSVFVSEFAAQRGMTVQGVYKAIKRHNIPTQQGVSNGKSAQFMTDEDAQRLNELLGPTESSNLILKNQLELQIQTEREQLIKEKADKIEELLREKEKEMTVTRELMMNKFGDYSTDTTIALNNMRSDMTASIDAVKEAYKVNIDAKDARISELENDKRNLEDQIERLKEKLQIALDKNTVLQNELVFAQQHPYKNLKASWDRKKEAKKDGQSTENNSESSSISS